MPTPITTWHALRAENNECIEAAWRLTPEKREFWYLVYVPVAGVEILHRFAHPVYGERQVDAYEYNVRAQAGSRAMLAAVRDLYGHGAGTFQYTLNTLGGGPENSGTLRMREEVSSGVGCHVGHQSSNIVAPFTARRLWYLFDVVLPVFSGVVLRPA